MKMVCTKCGGEDFVKDGLSRKGVQRYQCVTKDKNGKRCGCKVKPYLIDEDTLSNDEPTLEEVIKNSNKLEKSKQRLQDEKRINRRIFRENTRVENAYVALAEALRKEIKDNPWEIKLKHIKPSKISKSAGIVHLSDLHFNELVNIDGNHYDFNVASKRLKLFAAKIAQAFKSRDIYNIAVVMTGDMLNSDRRTDEIISMATNRACATFIGAQLLSLFIAELATNFNIQVISVSGNESRIREEYSHVDHFATDSFDFMMYEIMKTQFEQNKIKNIKFEYKVF